ncbi:hypothetical protein WR25_11869 isoform D [Diploscapter pachys]|nr:hypothetical protein WR25_11869 isoform D [Diploscapter pachys]
MPSASKDYSRQSQNNQVNGHIERFEVRKQPHLAHSLDILLADASALAFFIQFLESQDKLNLIKFWMHVEGFKASMNTIADDANVAALNSAIVDARNIYNKYIEEESTGSISVPKRIRQKIFEEIVEVNPIEKSVLSSCFDDAQDFIRQMFEHRYFSEFQNSVYYKKHELEVLSQGCSLYDILCVQSLMLIFVEFMETNREDSNMLQFLIACDSFENDIQTKEDNEALEDAMAIYDKYFSMQATSPIEIGAPLRVELESDICTEDGRPKENAFHTCKRICINRLQDKYLRKFVASESYLRYILDLRTSIENTIDLPRPNGMRTRSGSDVPSSSDSSFTTTFHAHQNLLEGKTSPSVASSTNSTPRRSIRTPRTPKSSNLAEIDDLGRYRPLYDDSLAQDGPTPSKLKLKLRKYLEKSAVKEEEVAEEVARSIIADMHNMVEAGQRG